MEDAGAEVSDEGALDEAVPEMGNQKGGNRVGADDRKRPRPALPAPDFDDPVEGGQEPETRPATGRNPSQRPDSLFLRAAAARRGGYRTDSLTGLEPLSRVIRWGGVAPGPTSNPEEVAMKSAKRRTSLPAAAGD